MTAISGIWCPKLDRDARTLCAQSLASQKIYGPDDTDQYDLGSLSMGRNLKSVLPEDRFDRQPIAGGDGRFLLVADLRLDNRLALARQLDIPTHQLETLCDANLLMIAYEKWREAAIDKLRGDFAFALWDAKYEKLILARDHVGSRPFFYYHRAGLTVFSSMPKGIYTLPDIPKKINLEFVEQTLLHASLEGENSYFDSISRVRPGHYAILSRNGCKQIRYWAAGTRPLKLRNHSEYVEAVKEQFDKAVSVRLRGANNVASHLSAGLDSSSVTTSAARALEQSGGRVSAYTAVPANEYVDESSSATNRIIDEGEHAAKAAALYTNIDHQLVPTNDISMFKDLDRMTYLQDMPIANLCNAKWMVEISELARKAGHTVFLTGQMGNMSFSYNGQHFLVELLRSGKFLHLARNLIAMGKKDYLNPVSQFRSAVMNSLPVSVQRSWRRARGGENFLAASKQLLSKERSRATARASNRVDDILWSIDRGELGNVNKGLLGGWGLDYRDPTADRDLLDLCFSIPTEEFLHNGVPRAIARDMLKGRLPEETVLERRKGLQAADWHLQFVRDKNRIEEELEILSEYEPMQNRIDTARLQNLMRNLPDSGWNEPTATMNYRSAILRTVSAGDFVRRMSGSNR